MEGDKTVATTLPLRRRSDTEATGLQRMDEAVDPLLGMALQNQVPVETVERIVAMIEKREEKNARQQFIEAMAKFRAECPLVQKPRDSKQKEQAGTTRSGSGFAFKYAPLDEITETIRPYAEKNGLSYTWSCRQDSPGILNVTCILQHIGGHEMRSDFPTPTAGSVTTNDQHKFAAAFTFGRRHSLFGVFGLATTDETPDKPEDMEKITEEQAANISALVDEVKADKSKLLAYAGNVERIEEIAANRYGEIVALLEKRRAKGGAA